MFSSGPNTAGLAVNGSEKFTFDSDGVLYSRAGSAICTQLEIMEATASATPRLDRMGAVYTNAGAGGAVTLTLPTLVAGYIYHFTDNNATKRLTVKPNTGDQLVWPVALATSSPLTPVLVSASGAAVSTARYDSFWGIAVDATSFVVLGYTGNWTLT